MQFVRNSLFASSETIFGVCAALGQDFGVSPTWFRVVFAVAVIFNMEYALIAYASVAAIVLASRIVFPGRGVEAEAHAEAAPVEVKAAEPVAIEAPAKTPVLAQAA